MADLHHIQNAHILICLMAIFIVLVVEDSIYPHFRLHPHHIQTYDTPNYLARHTRRYELYLNPSPSPFQSDEEKS